jgi:hypothetical protein
VRSIVWENGLPFCDDQDWTSKVATHPSTFVKRKRRRLLEASNSLDLSSKKGGSLSLIIDLVSKKNNEDASEGKVSDEGTPQTKRKAQLSLETLEN